MEEKKLHKNTTSKEQLSTYLEANNTSPLNDASSSRTNILLKNFIEAGKRTRISLMAISIASILLLIGIFNHQWSWLATKEYRQHELMWPDHLKEPIDPNTYANYEEAVVAAINRLSENEKPKYPRHQIHDLLEVEMKTIEVPILGIQIYIEDMPILGGIGITFLLVWLYFVRRRERSIVKMLHSVATFAKPEEKKYQIKKIYTTLAFSQVFNTIPKVDSVAKSSIRKWISSLKIKPSISKLFSYFMPFIPCVVIAVVIVIDCRETFWMESEQRLIPNIELLKNKYSTFPHSNKRLQTEFADSIFEQSESNTSLRFRDTIAKIRHDTLSTFSQKVKKIKAESKKYKNEIKEIKKSIFNPATTLDFYTYRSHQFKDFLHHHPRLPPSWTLVNEIWWIRTILPICILLLNFMIAARTASQAKSRDFHMEGIFIQYEKYYPQNYNIYKIKYAYVSILLHDKTNAGREQEVVIKAVNNYRSCKTNEYGFARFIELQELDHKEIFEFYFKKDRPVAHPSMEFELSEIKRYGLEEKDEDKEISENPIENSEIEKINKPNSTLKDEIERIMNGNMTIVAKDKKSFLDKIKSKLNWVPEDNRHKPISAITGKPITRLDATNELVKGEILIRCKIQKGRVKHIETIRC